MKNDLLLYKNIMDLSLDGSSQEVILRALQPRVLHVPRLVALCEFHQVFDFGVLFYSLLDQVVRRPGRRELCPLFDREKKKNAISVLLIKSEPQYCHQGELELALNFSHS